MVRTPPASRHGLIPQRRITSASPELIRVEDDDASRLADGWSVMVKRLVEFPLEDGGTVLVQAEDGTAAGGHDGGEVTRGWGNRDERVVLQAQQSFEQAVGRVQPAVQALVRRLRSVAESPEEIKVDFGLELSAEVGAFVAGASSTGNFTVSMTWRPARAPRSVPDPAESGPDDPANGTAG